MKVCFGEFHSAFRSLDSTHGVYVIFSAVTDSGSKHGLQFKSAFGTFSTVSHTGVSKFPCLTSLYRVIIYISNALTVMKFTEPTISYSW